MQLHQVVLVFNLLSAKLSNLPNTQIAGKLSESSSTIKSHVSNILSKLVVASRLIP
jgi:DNA-binding NarL/FixJ family response regulator